MASDFDRYIASLSDKTLFLERLAGNNGDALILKGMYEILIRNSVELVDDASSADLILLNGGGAMNDLWPTGAAQVLESYLAQYPDKQFVVGPSSYLFNDFDFTSLVNSCKGELTLFCREKISRDYLANLRLNENVSVRLSRDLAFELEDSSFITDLRRRSASELVLCAIRKDLEGSSGFLAQTRAPWLPAPIRRPLSRLRDRLTAMASSDLITDILEEDGMTRSRLPKIYRDVSVSVGFDEFCHLISKSALIITDRLHVAILGSMLDKQVRLIQGRYHKAKGVYDYSLSTRQNVKFYSR